MESIQSVQAMSFRGESLLASPMRRPADVIGDGHLPA
jgi:hypothetical protein